MVIITVSLRWVGGMGHGACTLEIVSMIGMVLGYAYGITINNNPG